MEAVVTCRQNVVFECVLEGSFHSVFPCCENQLTTGFNLFWDHFLMALIRVRPKVRPEVRQPWDILGRLGPPEAAISTDCEHVCAQVVTPGGPQRTLGHHKSSTRTQE